MQQKTQPRLGFFVGVGYQPEKLLQLRFLVCHMLACLGIELHDLHFFGHGFLVLGSRIKMTGAGS